MKLCSTGSAGGPGLDVCTLLSSDQVSMVLPGHDGGSVTHSGGSLLKGVDAYQCSYSRIADNDFRLLTVILNVASTDELFAEIKPTGSEAGAIGAIAGARQEYRWESLGLQAGPASPSVATTDSAGRFATNDRLIL
jgi:hypothetical protein